MLTVHVVVLATCVQDVVACTPFVPVFCIHLVYLVRFYHISFLFNPLCPSVYLIINPLCPSVVSLKSDPLILLLFIHVY